MRKLIWLLLLLSGCAAQPKCANIALYDCGDDGYYFKNIHWFQAELHDHPFDSYTGMAVVKKYLGSGAWKETPLCEKPAKLDGWYSVYIPEGKGAWILRGEGEGRWISVRPNVIRAKELHNIQEELK